MNRRGFSLVELLLATALLAAALALAFGIVQGAARAGASAERLALHNDRLRTAQAFVRRQVADALPQPLDPTEGIEALTLLEVAPDRLAFVGLMPGTLARGGAYVQVFRLVRGRGGQALVFEYRMMTPTGVLPPERPAEVLIDGLEDARFSVRGFGPDGRPEDWRGEWERPGQLPTQVRLEARFRDRRWRFPTMVVPLRYSLSGVVGLLPEAARRDTRGEGER
ncbi:MAG: prepilin-type N-terminal cleavage/methylation domain-containing protein [Lysobacteraceae bacterium]|nr:prepilin-type N-terminal cleavage/methylation domain-containing protein [Xanthomonadaceae bacterium]MCZ8318663.1 prepilin-type N-terminal cleavage/methylation domain-containing protein [Silanimonas sp.]